MTNTKTTSTTISESTSLEVGASFKKFSGGVEQSVDESWSETSTKTFSASIKTTYTFTIPAHTHMTVSQLLGSYGGVFDIYSENYFYHYEDLQTGEKTTKSMKAKILVPLCEEEDTSFDCEQEKK